MIPKQTTGRKKLNKNAGSAMIVALVVCVVVMTMCLMLLLVTYTLFSQTSRQNTQLQCKNMAQSFAESFEKELADDTSDLVKYLNELMEESDAKKRWQAIDADETNDPNYDAAARTELLLAVEDVDGFVVRIAATYEMAEESTEEDEAEEETKPEEGAGQEGVDGGEPLDTRSSVSAEFVITCEKGELGDKTSDSYTVICQTEIPAAKAE